MHYLEPLAVLPVESFLSFEFLFWVQIHMGLSPQKVEFVFLSKGCIIDCSLVWDA